MTGYLERLIGRVAHGRADTRPARRARFAEPTIGPAPPETLDAELARPSERPQRPAGVRPPEDAPSPGPGPVPAGTAGRSTVRTTSPSVRRAETGERARETAPFPARPRDGAQPGDGGGLPPGDRRETQPAARNPRTRNEPANRFLLPPEPRPASLGASAPPGPPPRSAHAADSAGAAPITVRIGRIEIQREPPKAPEPRAAARPDYRPRLDLKEYLAQRRRGER